MTPIAIDLAGYVPAPPRVQPPALIPADFALLVEQVAAEQPEPPEPLAVPLPIPALPAGRQDLAGEEGEAEEQSAQAEDEEVEAPIWLPASLTLPPPAATPLHRAAAQPVAPELKVEFRAMAADPILEPEAVETPVAEVKDEAQPEVADALSRTRFELPPAAREAARAESAAQAPSQPTPPALQPQIAAATLPAILLQSAAPAFAPTSERLADSLAAAEPSPVAPSQSTAPQRVEASGGASDAQLDMGRGDWIESMIERIDAMQAEGGERVALIRLRPDALGAVEVRVRQEGETMHVAFAADNPAARQMLSDAAPRLAELAEARGLKLGDSGVSQGFDRGTHAERSRPAEDTLPNRAPRRAADATPTRNNERIA